MYNKSSTREVIVRPFHLRRGFPIFVVILGASGALYCGWALHRVSDRVLVSDDHWPRAWPCPDNWLAALDDWYDARYPVEPGFIKLRSELPRVRLTVAAALAACLLVVLAGVAMVAIKTANAGNPRTNYKRRIIGLAICLSPVALGATSLSIGLAYSRESKLGLGFAVAGLLLAGVNFYLSFIRPLIFAWRHRSTEQMHNASGLPLIGTVLIAAGAIVGFADRWTAIMGLLASALDTGGLPWFAFMTWHDRGLWDGELSCGERRAW